LNDAGKDDKLVLSPKERLRTMKETIKTECTRRGIQEDELKAGGRRAIVAESRAAAGRKLVGEHGLTLAEVASNVGLSTITVSKIMRGGESQIREQRPKVHSKARSSRKKAR
jgi:hypothetical protein